MSQLFLSQAFPYGASYSPLIFPETDWDGDLSLMEQAGMNLVRVGDVHGSWDRLEPEPGKYDFERLGIFYRAAEKYGISVLISTGASCPPLWLAREFPDLRILSSRGERYPLGASYHWACIHHPAFLKYSDRYLAALAGFIKEFPNHFGWQITNEIGFPFNPTRETGVLDQYCFCEQSRSAFQSWVRDKYLSLEAVTEAWAWGTTNFVYNSWEDIQPPESLPDSWTGVTRWLDWRLFWQDAFAKFAHRQHCLLKEIDPEHPTSINTFNFKGYDRFGTFTGLDQWKIAQKVDHIGYDLYPGSGDKLSTRPEHNSLFLDHGRCVSRITGNSYWLHELESGPIGGWLLGPDHKTDGQDLINYCVEALGHDVKMMLYMPWKEWDYQPLHWGALVDLNGSPTERLAAARKMGNLLQENADFLQAASVPESQVLIIESKPNAIFLRGVDQEELLFKAQRGAYRAFWELGFAVDFLSSDLLQTTDLSHYRVICLPMMGLMSKSEAQKLAEYVSQGGVLIAFSRTASLDRTGWYHHQLPIAPFKDVFGLERIEPDHQGKLGINLKGQEFFSCLNRDQLSTKPETEVLAEFDDGFPAVTIAKYGNGHGVYIATQADLGQIQNHENNLLQPVIKILNQRQNIIPGLRIDENNQSRLCVDPHILQAEHKTWLLISCYATDCLEKKLKISLKKPPQKVQEIYPTQQDQLYGYQHGILSLELSFAGKQAKILEIYPQA